MTTSKPPRIPIRWPWRRGKSRLGVTQGGFTPVRPGRRSLKRALIAGAGLVGFALGSAFGDDLLARALPGRAHVAALAVAGNVHTTPAQIASASGLHAGFPLADVDEDDVARALEALPWVRDARATTVAPNRVVVAIEERVPVAVARLADGSRYLVDASGVAFAPAPAETRGPELIGLAALPPGGRADPALAGGVALLQDWIAARLPAVRAIEISSALGSEAPAVLLEGRELRVVLGGGESREKLALLGRVLALNEPALARATAIDLRFPGQSVLRFAPLCSEPELLGVAAANETDSNAAVSRGGEKLCHAKTT
ncbi:MAG TPA: FtsQ-type POTRA domain-containing protein [Myxococcota bacterium]|nr:FtsQ-type POTRA domain-containing protein [Myxococcota bacterium]